MCYEVLNTYDNIVVYRKQLTLFDYFVIGPKRLDIFTYAPTDEEPDQTVIEASNMYRKDIMCTLAMPVYTQATRPDGLNDTTHLHVLASLANFCLTKRGEALIDIPPCGRETVALGVISPHHVADDSSQATSATPPSYNLLNYNANINRYFNSNPMLSGDCDGAIALTNHISDDERDAATHAPPLMATSRSNSNTMTTDTSDSFDMSEGSTSASAISMRLLTTDSLLKHNTNMERNLLKEFKKTRCNLLADEKENDTDLKAPAEVHGTKRCASTTKCDTQQANAKRIHLNNEQPIIAPTPTLPIRIPLSKEVHTLPSYVLLPRIPSNISSVLRHNSVSIPSTSRICSAIYYVPRMPQTRPQNPLPDAISTAPVGMPTRFIYMQPMNHTQPLQQQTSGLLCQPAQLRPVPFKPIQNVQVSSISLISSIIRMKINKTHLFSGKWECYPK